MIDEDTLKPKPPGVNDAPDNLDTEDDFPDTWGDEPDGRPHNEPEAEPLSDPSPLDSSKLSFEGRKG